MAGNAMGLVFATALSVNLNSRYIAFKGCT